MGTEDQDALNVSGRRRSRVERGVARSMKLRSIIGILNSRDDVGGIEEYHKMLGQIGKRVHHRFVFGEEYRASLRDT